MTFLSKIFAALFFGTICTISVFSGSVDAASSGKGSVLVITDQGGSRAGGVMVSLNDGIHHGVTGADGTYLFKDVLPGGYRVTAVTALEGPLGYNQEREISISVSAGNQSTAKFDVKPRDRRSAPALCYISAKPTRYMAPCGDYGSYCPAGSGPPTCQFLAAKFYCCCLPLK